MRQFLIATAMAMGLIALWAAILPLTAQPAPTQITATSPAMSKALFLCRSQHGIDRACAASLAQALVLETTDENAAVQASNRFCRVDRQAFASLDRQH